MELGQQQGRHCQVDVGLLQAMGAGSGVVTTVAGVDADAREARLLYAVRLINQNAMARMPPPPNSPPSNWVLVRMRAA